MIQEFQKEHQTSLLHKGLVDHRGLSKSLNHVCFMASTWRTVMEEVGCEACYVNLYMHMEK